MFVIERKREWKFPLLPTPFSKPSLLYIYTPNSYHRTCVVSAETRLRNSTYFALLSIYYISVSYVFARDGG